MRSLWDRPERKQWSGGGADLPGIHSVVVDPRDSRHVALGVSTGGVWITRDDGDSWQLGGKGLRAEYLPPENAGELVRQDVHRVVTCAAQPDVLWLQHHNGIFRSQDFGLTWTEITNVAPSAFGFAVAAHPRRPEHRLVRARPSRTRSASPPTGAWWSTAPTTAAAASPP